MMLSSKYYEKMVVVGGGKNIIIENVKEHFRKQVEKHKKEESQTGRRLKPWS